jgi:hypothetical protein
MGFIKAGDLKYRICQAHGIFVPFTLMLLAYFIIVKLKTIKKATVAKAAEISLTIICGALIFAQTVSLWQYFNHDYRRWTEEKAALTEIAELLENTPAASEKPVIFLGEFPLSEEVMTHKFVRSDNPLYKAFIKLWSVAGGSLDTTDCDETYVLYRAQGQNGSVITWGIDAFDECNTELLNIMEYLGYTFIQGSIEQYEELSQSTFEEIFENADTEKTASATITEKDEYIVVFFG